jgi:ubiquinone/menaquinone biosynthesis C-methylase UbiE
VERTHRHPIFARLYPRVSGTGERRGAAEHRRSLKTGTAEGLPANADEFDVAVASLVLCSVADQDVALREIGRVLRPGSAQRTCIFSR